MSDEDVKDVVDKVEENKPKGRSEVRDIQNDEDVVNEIVDKIIKNKPSTNFNIRNPYKPKKFK